MKFLINKTTLAAAAALLVASTAALADVTLGVSLSLTGPGSGLGIPAGNGIKMWPATIGGEKIKVVVLDDATDPTKAVANARKMISENKIDILIGSSATPATVATAFSHAFWWAAALSAVGVVLATLLPGQEMARAAAAAATASRKA